MNLAEWTPMTTTGSFAKRSSTRRRIGRTCMQLMQQYVQKSRTATRPRRSPATLSGRRALIQVNPGRNSGQRTRDVGILGIYTRVKGKEREYAAPAGAKRAAPPSAQGLLDFRGQPLGLALVAQRGRYRDGPAGGARDLQIVIRNHPDLHPDLQRDVADLCGGRPDGPRQAEKVKRDREPRGARDNTRAQKADVERDQHQEERERHEDDSDHAGDEKPEQLRVRPAPHQVEEQASSADEDEGEERHDQRGADIPAGGQDEARATLGAGLDDDARGLGPRWGGGRRPRRCRRRAGWRGRDAGLELLVVMHAGEPGAC